MSDLEIFSINNICRACLSDRKESFKCLAENKSLLEMFIGCTQLKVENDDGLPMNLCSNCLYKCVSWYSFKQLCERTELMLKEQFNFKKTIKPKNEPLHDQENHSHLSITVKIVENNSPPQSPIEPNHIEPEKNSVPITKISLQPNELKNLSENVDDTKEMVIEELDLFEENENNQSIEVLEYNEELDETLYLEDDQEKVANETVELPPPPSAEQNLNPKSTCKQCGQIFRNLNRLEAHERSVHLGEKPEICEICKKSFDNLRSLRRHRLKHTDLKKYECLECEKTYKYQTSLTLHKKKHENIRRYICDLCGRSFVRAHGLQSHMLSHSKETPFGCQQCGKKFKNQIMLRNHQLRHEGIKKFECSECGKLFTTSAELTTHNRSHTGEKPYPCTICTKSFKTKSHLSVHFRGHAGIRPFSCDLCPSKFAHNKVLKQHRLTHTGERPFTCEICQRPFRQKNTLNVHKKTHQKLVVVAVTTTTTTTTTNNQIQIN